MDDIPPDEIVDTIHLYMDPILNQQDKLDRQILPWEMREWHNDINMFQIEPNTVDRLYYIKR